MENNDIKLIENAYNFFESSGFALPVLSNFKYSGKFIDWEVVHFEMDCFGKTYNYSYASAILSHNSEYCEKLSHLEDIKDDYCFPVLCHKNKKKDLICRKGTFNLYFYCHIEKFCHCNQHDHKCKINNQESEIACSDYLYIQPGDRVTINPGTYHTISPAEENEVIDEEFCVYGGVIKNDVILGEVSSYDDNDDFNFLEDENTERNKPKLFITKYILKWEDRKLLIVPK